jgi:hypothetical protein
MLGFQLTGMSAASAAPSHPASSVGQAHQAKPDTTPSGTFYVFFPTDPPGGYVYTNCTAGNHPTPGQLQVPPLGTYVENYCNVRVWLAEYSNGTGYELCISPNGNSGQVYIYRSYRDMGVSTNGSNC